MARLHGASINAFDCRAIATVAAMQIAALIGCGGKPAQVSGTVTLDGKPLERGVVGFTPVAGGLRAAGIIQSDGRYTLTTNRESGLETGEYRVTVVSREPGPPSNGGPPMPGPYITPERYAVESTSGLFYTVAPGNNTIDIELTSDAAALPAEATNNR